MLIETIPMVAMDFMNATHQEDKDIINALYELIVAYEHSPSQALKESINSKYEEWFEHTIHHFRAEEQKMQALNFPPYMFHKGEHDRALSTMQAIFMRWQKEERVVILKEYFEKELVQWLVVHIQTMDTVTANFFKTGQSPCSAC